MHRTETNKGSRWLLLLPACIVLFCMLCIYALHSIFPFGTESVVYDDMGQCSVPIFYAVWDALHGDDSILYNLRTAGGVFISGAYEGSLSLFNVLFFLICPRDRILESMSFFLLLKMMIASVTAMLLFRHTFRLPTLWQIALSVLYAFNPFLLQYYSNASWLEIVMIAPLIFLGAVRLLREQKPLLYTFSLAYCLILQLYISYMVVLFLFLNGALFIILLLPLEQRRAAAVRFGISTVIALGLSAFSTLPCYFYMTSTSRFQNTKSYFNIIFSTSGNTASKIGMLLILTALPLALCLILALYIRRKTRIVLYFWISLALFLLPILFENINLLWHMGSYIHFSMRYAFLFHLMLLCASAYLLSEMPQALFLGKKLSHAIAFSAALCLTVVAVAAVTELYKTPGKGIIYTENFNTFKIVFCLCLILYLLLFLFGPKRLSTILICGFMLFETFFYANRAVTTGSKRDYEYSLDFIEECDNIHDTLPIENDGITRIKNIDGTLNSNYPLITGYPSMSNFTHTIPATIKQTMLRLGYSAVYTRILDTGGTLFSDALLGCRYALSLKPLPNQDYTYLGQAGSYGVYESAYALPFGTVCSQALLDDSIFSKYAFDTLNNVWHAVSQSNEDLFDKPDVQSTVGSSSVTYGFDVNGTKEVYIVLSGMTKRKNVRIFVNGGVVPIPTLGEPDNTAYTTRFNNSLLDLGEYTNAHLTVRVEIINPILRANALQMRVACLDKSLLAEYCAAIQDDVSIQKKDSALTRNRKYEITVSAAQDGQYLFLPVTFDPAVQCRVNGKPTETQCALGTFTAIPLQNGQNHITVTFVPKGFTAGVCISILFALLYVVWIMYHQKLTEYIAGTKCGSFVLVAYYAADDVALVALYLVPIAARFYTYFAGG